ncbi:hypothetical protein D7S78_18770 [Ralstonia pickettii]|nr:hypothetical protein [Ralstonia sp.]MBA9847579.1 hypothetical protein [Ralstonia pickettii]MBA4236702.1 hypothetical protein [Ralstonia sp.]MBA4403318.1 hypothetical protein [Ralstonia sp.]MBA9852956.1 hypothetical protein [Ralstonia pickettii]
MPRYSQDYLMQLLASSEFDALVELQGILLSWPGIDARKPDYGAPPSAFAFIEALTWFSQTIRSGAWTYFEAVPLEKQTAMLGALRVLAPPEVTQMYKLGMEHWRDADTMKKLDCWVMDNESTCNAWLRALVQLHKNELIPMCEAS